MKIIIVGTGKMSPGIAWAGAATGASVSLAGRSEESASRAARETAELGAAGVEFATIDDVELETADLVIETVIEDESVKKTILSRVETRLPPSAIVVTNTSGLSVTGLAGALRRPERFAGLHFLYPAHLTEVVEIIPGDRTAPETIDALERLVRAMQKTPLTLKVETAGGLWNRLQFAVLREALALLELGVADATTIDAAVSDGLAPRWVASGPLATVDLGGPDTFSRAGAAILPTLDVSTSVPNSLRMRTNNEAAFFDWRPGERQRALQARTDALRMASQVRARRPQPRPLEGERHVG